MAKTPKIIRLPRLPTNWQTQPQLVERYWDEAMTAIEKALNEVLSLPVIQDQLKTIDDKVEVATQAAADAVEAASQAGSQTSAQRRETSLNQSYVTGYTGALVTASASGVVTVADHTRVYGDSSLNPSVSVIGASIDTGASAGAVIRIYYDDPSRGGGAVSYAFTKDPDAPPVQSGDRHSVGAVTIPATGSNNGNGIRPPGYVEP